jgi:hypothetical protein
MIETLKFCAISVALVALALSLGCQGVSTAGKPPSPLVIAPEAFSFTGAQAGESQRQTGTIQNTGSSDITVSALTVAGNGFSVSGFTPPLILVAGQSASFYVTFTPPTSGSYEGNVEFLSDASDPNASMTLTGIAVSPIKVGQLAISPATITIGNTIVGKSKTAAGTLSASDASVTVSSVTVGGSGFSITGLSLPKTIAPGRSEHFTVIFTPQTSGVSSGSLTFSSDSSDSPTVATLSGTGIISTAHYVGLSWMASMSPNITGYNVYRSIFGPICSSYLKIGSTSSGNTTYADSSVADGLSYCYATTTIDSENIESVYSNSVIVSIPPT